MSAPPFHVSFVCSGNICRSPYAEVRLRQEAERSGFEDRIRSSSLGTLGIDDAPAHELSIEVAAERGMNLVGFRSRGVDPKRVAEVDLLVALARNHHEFLREQFPERSDRIWLITAPEITELPEAAEGIPDPIGVEEGLYRSVLTSIDLAIDNLWPAILRIGVGEE